MEEKSSAALFALKLVLKQVYRYRKDQGRFTVNLKALLGLDKRLWQKKGSETLTKDIPNSRPIRKKGAARLQARLPRQRVPTYIGTAVSRPAWKVCKDLNIQN